MKIQTKNKRGWLRIVESFTTILLVSFVLLLILNRSNFSEDEKASQITDSQYSILREVQLNGSLRDAILSVDLVSDSEIDWDEFNTNGLDEVRLKILDRTPGQLNCSANLCSIGIECKLEYIINSSIYSRSAIITSNLVEYNPRELKLFCWDI